MTDPRGYKSIDVTDEVRALAGLGPRKPVCAAHCRHRSRVFRGWAACCRCDAATAVLPELPEGGFMQIEEKSHGLGVQGPLLSLIDRRVIEHHGKRADDPSHDYNLAADAMSYLAALDNRLSQKPNKIVVVSP